MIGGERKIADYLNPIFEVLAPGKNKAGVMLVRMVRVILSKWSIMVSIRMMEALAEGFELMHAKQDFSLDLEDIARIWQDGSVVRSWLLDLTRDALQEDRELSNIESWVDDSGEGRWTVH